MPSRTALAAGFLAGVLVGGTVAVAAVGLVPADRVASPSLSYTTATGCVDDAPPSSGWVGTVPVDDVVAVPFNATLVHDEPAILVNGTLDGDGGRYVLTFTVAPDTEASERKGDPPADCQPRTVVEGAASLPADYERLTVVVDGTTVATFEPDRTGATYRPFVLPTESTG